MTKKEKIELLEEEVNKLKSEISAMKQHRENKKKEHINTITDTEIILTDSLNDDDRYVIKIMSGNIFVEKVGE